METPTDRPSRLARWMPWAVGRGLVAAYECVGLFRNLIIWELSDPDPSPE